MLEKILRIYKKTPLVTLIMLALLLGAIVGSCVGPSIVILEPLGELMLKLFKMVVLPLIFTAIVVGIGGNSIKKTGRVALKILPYYFITTMIAATIACILSLTFKPGIEMNVQGNLSTLSVSSVSMPSFSDFIIGLIPENIVSSFSNNEYLKVVVFAVIFGFSLSALKDSDIKEVRESIEVVYKGCRGIEEVMLFLVRLILYFTPFGVFALIAVSFSENSFETLKTAAKLVGIIYFAYAIHLIVIYPSILVLFGKINPISFYKKIREAMIMAFSTRSSSSTLPVSLQVAEENLGVSKNVFSFTLPLGSQINLDGESIYQIVAVFMVAYASGISFKWTQIILLVIIVTFGGSGTAGIAGSGPVILMGIMGMIGLDISSGTSGANVYAIILGLDVILDMGRTMLNVTGDMVGTCIVAKSENELDLSKW